MPHEDRTNDEGASNEHVIATKMCNALFADAKMSAAAEKLTGMVGATGATKGGADLVARMSGGYWVGGTATLTDHALYFAPNGMNASLQDGISNFAIPLASVRDVRWRWGVLTGIVDIVTAEATRSIRCFNAKAFARKIDAARASA
ncbi:MAG: hypothetical protein AB7E80_14650 [Hyphomicrobiaceae bacterium]